MPIAYYNSGTVSVTNGQTEVTGDSDVNWLPSDIRQGDMIVFDGTAQPFFLDIRDDNRTLHLEAPFTGETASGVTYRILRMSGDWGSNRVLGLQVASYVQALATGMLFEWVIALSAETSEVGETSDVISFVVPRAVTVSEIQLSLNEAGTDGPTVCDVKLNGVSVFTTKVSIDANETSSLTAATPPVIVSPDWAKGDLITIDITAAGAGAVGLKLAIVGQRKF